jgi:hypothetical protein
MRNHKNLLPDEKRNLDNHLVFIRDKSKYYLALIEALKIAMKAPLRDELYTEIDDVMQEIVGAIKQYQTDLNRIPVRD